MTFSFAQSLRNSEHKTVQGKLYPSGRFSLVQTFPKKGRKLNNVQYHTTEEIELLMLRWEAQNPEGSKEERWSYLSSLLVRSNGTVGAVGLSDEAISPNRANRGSGGINSRQRDLLCWAASTLEHVYGQANLSFLTYTLPDLDPKDLEAVKSNWADIVNRVQLRIKEKLHGKGVESALVGCVELQLERYQNGGVLYPHLHMVFRGRKDSRSDWAIKPHQFRQIWRRCVCKFLGRRVYDWRASENIQQVRKSVAGYLAKYVSKCASKTEPGILSTWHPSDWIFVGRRIRSLYKTMCVSGYDIAATLDNLVRSWHPDFGYVNRISINTKLYGERFIGFCGWLRGESRYPDYGGLHACVQPKRFG